MLKNVSRTNVIQGWFAAVILVIVAGVAFGTAITASTGAFLLALSVVPPAIVLVLWPRAQTPTVAEVLHSGERRP